MAKSFIIQKPWQQKSCERCHEPVKVGETVKVVLSKNRRYYHARCWEELFFD